MSLRVNGRARWQKLPTTRAAEWRGTSIRNDSRANHRLDQFSPLNAWSS